MFGRQPHTGFSHEANIKQLGAGLLPVISTALTAFSTIASLTKKEPKAPRESLPGVMPTEDSSTVAEAKRRALVAQAAKGGRTSTVLTDDDSFGGN